MNSKLFFLCSIALLLILTGCNFDKNEKQSMNFDNASSSNSIKKLDDEMLPKIVGLWKIYKVETRDGTNEIVTENYYLNIKENKTYESSQAKGNWAISYGFLDGVFQTFFTFMPLHENAKNSDDAKTRKLFIYIENQTTYLKLIDLNNNRTKILVHQN